MGVDRGIIYYYYIIIYYIKILWWGGGMVAGKKIKNEGLWEKNEKGKTKREENYIKNGGKGFKNASFRVVKCKL